MKLIADSGSTKTDWAIIGPDGSEILNRTKGFNPYFHDESFIVSELSKHEVLKEKANDIELIQFYGSGSSSVELKEKMKRALQGFFPDAHIKVEHDLLGAARATFRGKAQISCILGTGSNACFHDGVELKQRIPSLGYVLGDLGSGSYFGKKLIQDYYYQEMPKEISAQFELSFNLRKDKLIRRLYSEPGPNVFLASFSVFLADIENTTYAKEILRLGFEEFINKHVKHEESFESSEINFVGSIAFHYHKLLRSTCEKNGLNFGHVVKSPIHGLMDYHN